MKRVYNGIEYLTRQEAARRLGVSLRTVDHLIKAGLLTRYVLKERYVRLRAPEVEALRQFSPSVLARA